MTQRQSIKKKLIGSVFILIVCFAMLIGTSLAWFTDNVSVGVGEVQTATYALDVTCTDGSAQQAAGGSEDSNSIQYTMNGTSCTFQLKAGDDDKTAKSGYCVITAGNETYITKNIQKGGTFTVTVHAPANTKITFEPRWGEPTEEQLTGKSRLESGNAITLPGYESDADAKSSAKKTKSQNSKSNATSNESKPTSPSDNNKSTNDADAAKTPEKTTPAAQPSTTPSEGAE